MVLHNPRLGLALSLHERPKLAKETLANLNAKSMAKTPTIASHLPVAVGIFTRCLG